MWLNHCLLCGYFFFNSPAKPKGYPVYENCVVMATSGVLVYAFNIIWMYWILPRLECRWSGDCGHNALRLLFVSSVAMDTRGMSIRIAWLFFVVWCNHFHFLLESSAKLHLFCTDLRWLSQSAFLIPDYITVVPNKYIICILFIIKFSSLKTNKANTSDSHEYKHSPGTHLLKWRYSLYVRN